MKLKTLMIAALTSVLTSCSSYKESFDCPPCRGVGCESITKVNHMVNTNKVESLQDEVVVESHSAHRFWMGKHVDSVGSCFDESLDMVKV
jgi:hypothetical protein